MSTSVEHYRKAERILAEIEGGTYQTDALRRTALQQAQVHATLAAAGATALNSGPHGLPYGDLQQWQAAAGVQAPR